MTRLATRGIELVLNGLGKGQRREDVQTASIKIGAIARGAGGLTSGTLSPRLLVSGKSRMDGVAHLATTRPGPITTKQTHRGGTASYTWCFHDDCVIHLPGFKDPQRGSLLNVRQPASRPGPRAIESRSRASVDTCTITVLREDRRTGCSDPASIPSSRRVFAGGAWGRIDRRSGRRAVSGRRQVRGSSTEQRRAA